jgi:hypothetical protein
VNKLKNIFLTFIHRIKQACLRPQTVVKTREHRRQWQIVRHEHESDRLDRLRNPAKYLGR